MILDPPVELLTHSFIMWQEEPHKICSEIGLCTFDGTRGVRLVWTPVLFCFNSQSSVLIPSSMFVLIFIACLLFHYCGKFQHGH